MLFHIAVKWINRFCSLWKNKNLRPPNSKCPIYEKASVCAFRRGSITVECALVLPLFLLGLWTIVSFMGVYQKEGEQLAKLCDKAKELGIYAHLREENPEIILSAVSFYESPLAIFYLPKVPLRNQVKVHSWVGYQKERGKIDAPQEMVYVTEHGSVYHIKGTCTHLRLSIRQMAGDRVDFLRNQYGKKYHPCERCYEENERPGIWIYITERGNRYHSSVSCSGLKRTIRLVSREEAMGLPMCGKCGGKNK